MYAGNYGYPNAGAPPSGQGPNMTQQQQQQQQQMMYNSQQQFPQGAGFPGAPNMMPGAGPAGAMMQNPGMQHMASGNGQMPNFQPSYSNSPYGVAGIPASGAPQMNMPQGYAVGGGMPMSSFNMQQSQMTPQQQQQMMQRMQAQSNSGNMPTATQQRPYPGQGQGLGPLGTPTSNSTMAAQQAQVAGMQNMQASAQGQAGGNAAQQQQSSQQPQGQQQQQQSQGPQSAGIQTPQTPTFPSNGAAAAVNGSSTPLSPGSESRENERVAVILDINNELLVESVQIQHTQEILKKEHAKAREAGANGSEKKTTEEEDSLAQDYVQCMRRLQGNLAYLAALADKKGTVQAGQCPQHLKAPALHTKIKLRPIQGPDGTDNKIIPPSDREETARFLQERYAKLQSLFPGIDPNNVPVPATGARAGAQGANSQKPGAQTPSQASPVPGNKATPKMATSGAPQTQPMQQTANPA